MANAAKSKPRKESHNFGDTVASLLDTYTRCLALLKGLGRGRQPKAEDDAASRLSKSIRSDRTHVRRAYSSGLKRRGASFEKGDAAARSSLRKVIRKLTSTLANLMRTFTHQPIDHESLMSLSSASRLDAIRTMSDLSGRVGSTYSLRSTRSHGSKKSRGRSHTKRSHDKGSRHESSKHRSRSSKGGRVSPEPNKNAHDFQSKRVSMATISSGSTKLGEIRGSRVQNSLPHKVTYPLHTYHSQAMYDEANTRSKKRWFGLFGGK